MGYGDRTSIIWLKGHIYHAADDQIKKFRRLSLLKNNFASPAMERFKQWLKRAELVFIQFIKNSYSIQVITFALC